MTGIAPNGVTARLDAIDQRLGRIESYLRDHDKVHAELIEQLHGRQLEIERRLTQVEGSVTTRSGLGVLGLVVSYALTLLGVKVN